MACNATVYKAHLNIADMDRHYYGDHNITLACHPSENEERMMVRLVAYILNADERLHFGKGLSTQEEPALWSKDDSNAIQLWIDLGQMEEKRIRHAAHRAKQVIIYTYQPNAAAPWFQHIKGKLSYYPNVAIYHLDQETVQLLGAMAKRTMRLNCTIQDGELWINNEETQLQVTLHSQPD